MPKPKKNHLVKSQNDAYSAHNTALSNFFKTLPKNKNAHRRTYANSQNLPYNCNTQGKGSGQ